jgi:hypothetical protein
MRKQPSGSWHAEGVINLDSITDAGAIVLDRNKAGLIEYFVKSGKILTCLK